MRREPKKYSFLVIYLVCTMFISCHSRGQLTEIAAKNSCFEKKLDVLKTQHKYKEVMSEFANYFKISKDSNRIFGKPNVLTNKIDESIFFNSKKDQCLLLILQRFNNITLFGQVRLIRGRFIDNKWVFKPSMVFSFDPNIINDSQNNSFEEISKLGRYSVLTEGDISKNGCEIDEEYWFKLLPTE